jgi:hypothetical protein
MLLPGRYVSDTTKRCMTISKSNWTTVLVDTCISAYSLASAVSTTGTASSSTSGGNLVLTAPEASDMLVITQNVVAGVSNTMQLDINRLTSANDNGVQVVIVEEINNVEYVIGSGYLHQGSKQSLNFTPTFDVAKLKIYGPFDEMLIATTCTKKAATVQHTYLVDVCDEDKDRYRFGFNGQEKVNEIAGVGNHNTAEFWEYDTRLGRRWNLEPLIKEMPWLSPYSVLENNPNIYIDKDGDAPFLIPVVIWAVKAFAVGAAVDAGTQVLTNRFVKGDDWGNSVKNVDLVSASISGGASVITGGTSNFIGNGAKVATKVTKAALTTSTEVAESVAKQHFDKDNKNGVTLSKTFEDVVTGKVVAQSMKNVNANNIKDADRKLDRATRVSNNDPSSSGRLQKKNDAQKNLNLQNNKAKAAETTVKSSVDIIKEGLKSGNINSGNPYSVNPNLQGVDNTSYKFVAPKL